MIDFEKLETFLPRYLSDETAQKLLGDLSEFPENIDQRMYGFIGKNSSIIYQGDGIAGLSIINLPDSRIEYKHAMILSNTCDADLSNIRKYKTNLIYAPIVSITKYSQFLIKMGVYTENSIEDHLSAIRKQIITQIFYLPIGQGIEEESLIFLDRILNCDSAMVKREELESRREFSLSQFGFYLFLYKLSIHFTRMHESVDRLYMN
ncbi:MAG: hypothetical protein PF693_09150 [Spirochaetia bacterium]|jgi:hypothetical protein|nr:hypothetical protein [Spirochaetia bacterium]